MPVFDPFDNRTALAKRAKGMLRKQMRGVRGALQPGVLTQHAEQIQRHILGLAAFETARTLALCAVPPTQRGVDLSSLADHARQIGKTVVYPRVDYEAQRVDFFETSESKLQARGLETAEAPADAALIPPDAIDLIVVPVLAVDPSGVFIGDGSGVYDNVLQHMAHAVSVAVAFEFQLIPEAPRTSEDVPVAVIVTDQRVLEARGERSDEDVTRAQSSTGRATKEVRRAKQPDSVAAPVRVVGGTGNWTRNRTGQYPQEGR